MAASPLVIPRADLRHRFQQNILQAGGMVLGDDGNVMRPSAKRQRGRAVPIETPYQTRADPLPSMIELDEEGTEHTVVVKRRSGVRIEVHAALRYGAVRDIAALQAETARITAALEVAPDRATRRALAAEQLAAEEDLLRLLFPDLPDGLIGDLDPRTVRRLTDLFGQLLQEAIGTGDDPNGQAGR